MQDIIQQLKTKAGLSAEPEKKAVQVITDFIGEKSPMIKGQLTSFMSEKDKGSGAPQVGGIDLGGLG